MEETKILNGNKLTESEFQEKKKEYEEQKDVKVVEIKKGEYKTRLYD